MHTILVIDDDPQILARLKQLIESIPGFNALLATNGKLGIEILMSEPVACVILDYQMPAMNGKQFLEAKRVLESKKDIPVILCSTTNDDIEFWERPLVKGWITAFLPKWCTHSELSQLLDELCIQKLDATVWERTLSERGLL
ncbi:response regulator [bacterium]|nr:response regulator [bacterium]